jgi:hypothetical protein
MWVKVDDRFPDHRKVFSAGAVLGEHATGRVLAVWLEAMCWTNSNGMDGFLPMGVVQTFKHDRQPLRVATAMAQSVRRPDGTMGPGLFVSVEGGYRVHDYGVHNDREKFEQTSERRSAAGRIGGKKSGEARRQAKLKQLLQQEPSNCSSNEQANANPVPDPVPEERTPPYPPRRGHVAVNGSEPRRRHPLDESPDYSQGPEESERAERFMERFGVLHFDIRRASYVANYERDRPHALRLVSTYSDRELEALTRIYMRAKGDHFDGKPRTIGRLAEAAPMIEEQMRREGQWPTAA